MDWRLHYPGAPDDGVKLLTRILTRVIPRRRRRYPLELVVAAILYRTSEGCKWRALERACLPWHVAYDYFRRWTASGALEYANALIVRLERRRKNRVDGHESHSEPAWIVVDAQTVKSRVAGEREALGYDGHKHVKGIKRHVATDLRGNVLACVCAAGNAHESQWFKELLVAVRLAGYRRARCVVADGGYRGQAFYAEVEGFELEVVMRSDGDGPKSEAKPNTFKPLKRRWVIERTFGGLRFNRLLTCCYERLTECSEANVLWGNIRTILRRWQKL